LAAFVGAGVGAGFVAVVEVAAASLAALAAAFFCAFVSVVVVVVAGVVVVVCAFSGCAKARLADRNELRAMILMRLVFMLGSLLRIVLVRASGSSQASARRGSPNVGFGG